MAPWGARLRPSGWKAPISRCLPGSVVRMRCARPAAVSRVIFDSSHSTGTPPAVRFAQVARDRPPRPRQRNQHGYSTQPESILNPPPFCLRPSLHLGAFDGTMVRDHQREPLLPYAFSEDDNLGDDDGLACLGEGAKPGVARGEVIFWALSTFPSPVASGAAEERLGV